MVVGGGGETCLKTWQLPFPLRSLTLSGTGWRQEACMLVFRSKRSLWPRKRASPVWHLTSCLCVRDELFQSSYSPPSKQREGWLALYGLAVNFKGHSPEAVSRVPFYSIPQNLAESTEPLILQHRRSLLFLVNRVNPSCPGGIPHCSLWTRA